MSRDVFHDVASAYEAMIDWPKRLANEGSFYRRLFDRLRVSSVVDVACGTGHHAELFRSWGLRVEGADISQNMIERARSNFRETPNMRWVIRGFDQPIHITTPFDAAICIGNSLALASNISTVQRTVQEMFAAVRSGGVVVLHILNLWRLPNGPCHWQKCQRATLERGDVLITKGVHRCGSDGYVDLIIAPVDAPAQMVNESVPFLGIEATELEAIVSKAGAASVQLFGNYHDQPYDRENSTDLIVVAER